VFWKERCIGCNICLEVCPSEAISVDSHGFRKVIKERCTLCGRCVEECYAGALKQVGRYMTVDEVLDTIEQDRNFYERSNGGVTISGGEPTTQPEFVSELFKRCRAKQIHTALDTCGQVEWDVLRGILRHVDLVLYDIKQMDPAKHRRFTGVSNSLILENAKKVALEQVPMVIRVPVVPGYNDDKENIDALAKFVCKLKTVKEIDLLPYHRFGKAKYERLGRGYRLQHVKPPVEEHMLRLKRILESHGFNVKIGG